MWHPKPHQPRQYLLLKPVAQIAYLILLNYGIEANIVVDKTVSHSNRLILHIIYQGNRADRLGKAGLGWDRGTLIQRVRISNTQWRLEVKWVHISFVGNPCLIYPSKVSFYHGDQVKVHVLEYLALEGGLSGASRFVRQKDTPISRLRELILRIYCRLSIRFGWLSPRDQ